MNDDLSGPLARLRTALEPLAFDLAGDEASALREHRDRLDAEIAGHLARIRDLEAPLLVVLGGVTGAGKSTIANTLVGEVVAAVGVIRPTTQGPTLVTAPEDVAWFTGERVLAGLPRAQPASRGPVGGGPGVLTLVPTRTVPSGLAIVDAPDVDSVREANRDLADALLDAADVWIWATSAGKYADEESMRYLRRAATRRTALGIVLTQVRGDDAEELVPDFRAKLAAAGLPDADLFVVPYTPPVDDRLPDAAVAGLRAWLQAMADPQVRRDRRRQTLEGALDVLPAEVERLLHGLDEEARSARLLLDDADAAYARARRDFADAIAEGLPLRQEVLGRWNRFVGTGRFLQLAEVASGRARSWVRSLLTGPVGAEEARLQREVRVEVGDTVAQLVERLGDLAAAEVRDRWSALPPGRDVLAAHPELEGASADLRERAEREVAIWQDHVTDLVATRGAERRSRARWLSTVLNAGATSAIVLALAQTGGLTGAEAGIATAAGAANQALLVKLLGAANLRWLVTQAQADLTARFERLAAEERRRFAAAVARAAPEEEARDAVEEALAQLRAARR